LDVSDKTLVKDAEDTASENDKALGETQQALSDDTIH
jgi:hypothetical protein